MSFLKHAFGHHQGSNVENEGYGGNDYEGDGQREHQSSFTHEAIAGAAGFAAIKAYEDHVRRSGEQVSHPLMKEMLAGFAAAEIDKLFETKGLDYLDREKAKRMAVQQAHQLAHDKYGAGGIYRGENSDDYQQQGYNQGAGYQQGGDYDYQNQDGRQNDYNQSYQRRDDDGYQQNRGDYDNYNSQGQQQWGGGDAGPIPEHHRHHHRRREEDD